VVIDDDEHEVARVKVTANKSWVAALLEFADFYRPRRWAIESAGGLGFLLARQLVRAGADIVDVPATLAARVRLLGSGRGSKSDPNDALSTAIAALRDPHLRTVMVKDHAMVLRLLADPFCLCDREPATTLSASRACFTLSITRLSGSYMVSSGLHTSPQSPAFALAHWPCNAESWLE
jgi:hypothetical protein